MKMMLTLSISMFLLSNLILMMNNLISKKSIIDREKASPFECGFDPNKSARMPFSLQFFLIAVIFLIFDVEITLLMPMILTMKISNPLNFFIVLMIFLLILLIGLYHEWYQGALNWSY